MKQKMEQRLSDIQELLKYIKAHLNLDEQSERGDKLDNIAQVTLTMVATLEEIKNTMGNKEQEVLKAFIARFDTTSEDLRVSLINLADQITSNTEQHTELKTLVDEAYAKYTKGLTELHETIDIRHEDQRKLYNDIGESIKLLSQDIKGVNDKILSKDEFEEILTGLGKSLEAMEESDKAFEKASKLALDTIDGQLIAAEKVLSGLGESFDIIRDSLTESNSRLSVVHVKVDAILDVMKKEIEQ